MEEKAGLQPDMQVNWIGDGESKQVNARDPEKNLEVDLNICHHATCVDHTFELASEETLQQRNFMKTSIKKLRSLAWSNMLRQT